MSDAIAATIHEEIVEMIEGGDLDQHLDKIFNTVQMRRATIGGQERANDAEENNQKYTLDGGDRVRFNSRVRPKYMEGETATVLAYSASHHKTVMLQLDSKKGRFKGEKIRAYKSTLDVIT